MNKEQFAEYIFTHPIHRLTDVYRYATTPMAHRESTAEHTFYASVYSLFIAEYLKRSANFSIDYKKLLISSILHDYEEAFTGDFLKTLKRDNSSLFSQLKDVALSAVKETFSTELIDLFNFIQEEKDGSLESFILGYADLLCVATKVYRELMLGNKNFLKVKKDCVNFMKSYESKIPEKFLPLKELAMNITETFIEKSGDLYAV